MILQWHQVVAGYSSKAQPYLDAIAKSVFSSLRTRDWIIKGTIAETSYIGSDVLTDEQRAARWRKKPTKQPFWANYFCGRDTRCTCRIAGSKSLESDAIFFFRNRLGQVLALHVEFKHPREPFEFGQPEGYPLRAECFRQTYAVRSALNPHNDWATVLFCGPECLTDQRLSSFQRVITHAEAARMIPGYPK